MSIPRQVRNLQCWYTQISANLIKATWLIVVLRAFISLAICKIKLDQTIFYHTRDLNYMIWFGNTASRLLKGTQQMILYYVFKINTLNNNKKFSKIKIDFSFVY